MQIPGTINKNCNTRPYFLQHQSIYQALNYKKYQAVFSTSKRYTGTYTIANTKHASLFLSVSLPSLSKFSVKFRSFPPPPDISLYRYKFFATPKVRRLSRRSNSRVTHRHRPRLKLLIPDTLVFNVEDDPQWYYTDKVQQYYNDRREHTGFFSGVYFTGE